MVARLRMSFRGLMIIYAIYLKVKRNCWPKYCGSGIFLKKMFERLHIALVICSSNLSLKMQKSVVRCDIDGPLEELGMVAVYRRFKTKP
ncbi:hypothetical protein Trydic_g16845 [Trypoxylus dichotomus]